MADSVLVSQADSCSRVVLGGGSTKGPIVISASVGLKGVNRVADVRIIQEALNDVAPEDGGPTVPLAVDGISGPKTQAAIRGFQLKHFGVKGADSRVDPNHQTIAKLNDVLGRDVAPLQLGFGGTTGASLGALRTGPERLAFVRTLLPEVRDMIGRARFHLTVALPFIDKPAPSPTDLSSAAASIALVNRHFAFDKLPVDSRRRATEQVAAIYDTMTMVFVRPGGLWGPAAFDHDSAARLPPRAKTAQAYTRRGAFFRPGEKTDDGRRVDSIYILDHFDRMPRPRNLRNLVHELAHFVSPFADADAITDLAYGWFDSKVVRNQAPHSMHRLTPDQRRRNADTYANLAYDAKFKERPPGGDL